MSAFFIYKSIFIIALYNKYPYTKFNRITQAITLCLYIHWICFLVWQKEVQTTHETHCGSNGFRSYAWCYLSVLGRSDILLIFVEQSVGNQLAAGCWQQPARLQLRHIEQQVQSGWHLVERQQWSFCLQHQ